MADDVDVERASSVERLMEHGFNQAQAQALLERLAAVRQAREATRDAEFTAYVRALYTFAVGRVERQTEPPTG